MIFYLSMNPRRQALDAHIPMIGPASDCLSEYTNVIILTWMPISRGRMPPTMTSRSGFRQPVRLNILRQKKWEYDSSVSVNAQTAGRGLLIRRQTRSNRKSCPTVTPRNP